LKYSYKWLLLFSLPSVVGSLLEPMASVVDSALVGNLNTTWLASLAVASNIFNATTWMFNFLIHASTQQISEIFEIDKTKLASRIKISLITALLIGLLSSIVMYFFRESLYFLAGGRGELIPIIDKYFVIRLTGHSFTILYITMLSIMRGMKKVYLTFIFIAISTLANIIISWFLLYRFNLGVEGAAYGTIFANFLGVICCSFAIFKNSEFKLPFLKVKIIKDDFFHFGKNSWHLFGRSFLLTMCFFLATKIAGNIGVKELAAHQILLQVWLFSSFLTDGIAISGNIICAEALGKRDLEVINSVSKKLLWIGLWLGVIFTILYGLGGSFIWSIFSKDKDIFLIVSSIWPFIFLSQTLNSLSFVYDGILFGVKLFKSLRNIIALGLIFIVAPFYIYAELQRELLFVWLGLIGLNIIRFMICHVRFLKFQKEFYF